MGSMQTQKIELLPFATDDDRYEAIRRRDARAEGQFYYSVATTGVYCRPTCAARVALRKNVAFYRTPEEAERAGYRACKRCCPREETSRQAQLVDAARALLDSSETPVALGELAAAAGLSPHHFHRLFKKHVGMTPGQYAAARRLHRFGEAVQQGATVTAAIYEAGYSSSSRFYEGGGRALGMRPSDLRRGGAGLEIFTAVRACALGKVLVGATARGVCAIAFGDDVSTLRDALRERFPRAQISGADDRVERLAAAVVALVEGTEAGDIPLDLYGTAFQQRVWRALRDIPRGRTETYAAIAARIGAPRAVRAVGSACGANPAAVAVPCHRALRSDGGLGGYRWGIERKRALLARERK
jgi:AraC family transcriptional regulator of adaptative response/methylated-DNA-[protein]-cysteine methyltransferase